MSVVLCRLDEIADGESRGFEHELEDDDIEFFGHFHQMSKMLSKLLLALG